MRLLLFCLLVSQAFAFEDRVPLNIQVPPMQRLTVDHYQLRFPKPSVSDLDRGFVEISEAIKVQVSSNVPWKLLLEAREPDIRGKASVKAVSDLQWRVKNSHDFNSITVEPALIAKGNSYCKKKTICLDCRMLVSWESDDPDRYNVGVNLQLLPLD